MTIQIALEQLRSRSLKFSTLKTALMHEGLPKSNNMVNLESKFATQDVPVAQRISQAKALERIYKNNVDWGDKAVQFAEFDRADKPLLDALVAHTYRPQLVEAQGSKFPRQFTDAEMSRLTINPQLVRCVTNATRTTATLYFYGREYETYKEEFPVAGMTDAVSQQRFLGYDHVVAYRRTAYQRIDTIFIDPANLRIEFRADVTRLTRIADATKVLINLKVVFRELVSAQVDTIWDRKMLHLANFFPKIEELYNGADGRLCALGHNTAAGATNSGKMRRGLSGDLKADPSHQASLAASLTEKFSITKAFSYYNGISTVTLSIPGKAADTNSVPPTINTAIVEDCINESQFIDMMQILR
ncbi:hypothetical protein [Herbaspirillum seropedicae]|uniref:hypothetical protein n=1 Tax=Herbaspirillum seropedicae TaxID=964 RepID=UPI003D990119